MKTILVPTDFSAAAGNAAHYAVQLAKKIKAGIKLCNAVQIPLEAPVAAHMAGPLEDYRSIKNAVTVELHRLAEQLKMDAQAASHIQTHYPFVSYDSEIGSVKDVVRNMADEQNVSLVVMGRSGAGGLARLFTGSDTRELIDVATFPVLLIPSGAVFKPLHKIAFATDLTESDMDVIQSLAGLARPFNAEILIAHCTDDKQENKVIQQKIDAFLSRVSSRVDYDQIYYRQVKSSDVERGLEWLAEHGQIDMLAMVHRTNQFLDKILKGSHTQKMARQIQIPLMVMPPGYCGTF
jgi:nucleotide-binding universal stress UspA family protein